MEDHATGVPPKRAGAQIIAFPLNHNPQSVASGPLEIRINLETGRTIQLDLSPDLTCTDLRRELSAVLDGPAVDRALRRLAKIVKESLGLHQAPC